MTSFPATTVDGKHVTLSLVPFDGVRKCLCFSGTDSLFHSKNSHTACVCGLFFRVPGMAYIQVVKVHYG
ncbi:hypothetical protein, partial [Faecalibaculum rodentium]|uniref:hypothetical protein n=1 Tax=Faecalibaculum rodentium TaxID=1702221 RepID=UPI00248D02C0